MLVVVFGLVSCGREAPEYAPGDMTVISTTAGAAIMIDGRDTGEITPHTFVGLAANIYNVSVDLAGFVSSPVDTMLELRSLSQNNLSFILSQTALVISSEPAGAAIFFDGEDTGHVTPATIPVLEPGTIVISLALDTYVITPADFAVDVIEGSVLTLPPATFSLRPQRTVVLEGFANINCGPCPQLTDNLLNLTAQPGFGPERVLYFEFALSFPNFTDPLYTYNIAENDDRGHWENGTYNIVTAPGLYIDGAQLEDELDDVAMEEQVLADLNVDPGFRIDVSADFTDPAIPATVTLVPDSDLDLTGHTLYVALYEKVIDFNERGLTVGTNGQSVFHHVFRDRVDTSPTLAPMTAGTPMTYNVTLVRGDWPLDNLVVIAFVQRDIDLVIIQAGSFGETAEAGGTP